MVDQPLEFSYSFNDMNNSFIKGVRFFNADLDGNIRVMVCTNDNCQEYYLNEDDLSVLIPFLQNQFKQIEG